MRPSILKTINNPVNPWQSHQLEWLGAPPSVQLEVFEDQSRSILSKNDSDDLPFRWSINPYRGCYHGCAYCYARPSHQYLDFGAGTDFERKLIVKKNAAALLKKHFMKKSWTGEVLMFSGNTDCYQPLEASYQLTRKCLQVCSEFKNPVSIITKGTLIERDIDLLRALNKRARLKVNISIPFWNPEHARAIEPYVASPARRIQTIKTLANAGITVNVMLSPIIPGLTDSDLPKILEAARSAGASSAYGNILRLEPTVAQVFEDRLRACLPMRADKIMNQIRACRGGQLNNARIGKRMMGEGPRWTVIEQLLQHHIKRLGFNEEQELQRESTFERPIKVPRSQTTAKQQLSLFTG